MMNQDINREITNFFPNMGGNNNDLDFFSDMMDFLANDKNKPTYKTKSDKSIEFTIDQGYMINSPGFGEYIVKFKNKKQVEAILDKKFKEITNYDLIFWVDAHRGTKYHTDFLEQYPEYAAYDLAGLIEHIDDINSGTFDFRNFDVPKDFKFIDYINQHFPYFA